MTPLRTTLALLLFVAAVVLAAGCIGILTGKGIDRPSMTPSDTEFEKEFVQYMDTQQSLKSGVMRGLENRSWQQVKSYAEGMKTTSDIYRMRLSPANYTVSVAFQKYQDAAIRKITLEQCTAENLIKVAEMDERNDSKKLHEYNTNARECMQQANQAGIEILQMIY
jgi:hypothetical protein